jgi:hypothetical protein
VGVQDETRKGFWLFFPRLRELDPVADLLNQQDYLVHLMGQSLMDMELKLRPPTEAGR